VSDILVKLRA